jgi:YhcG PDDEXK nuclease domain
LTPARISRRSSRSGDDFYIDLLFYHLKLRAFIVVDLKTRPFKPEFAGKINLYGHRPGSPGNALLSL